MFNFDNIELYGFYNKIISNIDFKISLFVFIMQGAVRFILSMEK